jgi:hypothetical protein
MAHLTPAVCLVMAAAVVASGSIQPARAARREDRTQAPARDLPARRGTAVIRGVVVDGVTGEAIRRAAVLLVIEQPDREGASVVSTTADSNGQFEFTGVPAARVQVTAARVGYFNYDNLWNGEPEEPVWQPVAGGQRIQGVRIALYRGGVVAGRVLDEFGEPAVGVEIEVLRREPGESDGSGSVRATSSPITPTTDDTGAFRVWGLAPGDYLVGARPNRFVADASDAEARREGYASTYYPGTANLSTARAVRVEPGKDTAGVSFGLVTVPLSTLRGTVLLPPETPGRGVTVGVGLLAPQRLDAYVTRGTRVRDDGGFELTRLAPGTYQVTARSFQPGGLEYWGSATVQVTGTDLDGVSIPLRAGAIVRGRVVTEAGEPVGVPVMVSLTTDGDRAPTPQPPRIYSDGSFRLEGAFGTHQVRAVEARMIPGAEAPGINVRALQEVTPATPALTTWWVKSIVLDGRDVTDEPIDFDQGGINLLITMTNRASSVRGTVAWNGAPGRRRPAVVVFVDDDTRWTRPSRLVGASEVDEAGRYDVRGLPPGARYLAVAVEGAARAVLARPEMLAVLRASATPLRIDEGGTHEVALTAVPRPRP